MSYVISLDPTHKANSPFRQCRLCRPVRHLPKKGKRRNQVPTLTTTTSKTHQPGYVGQWRWSSPFTSVGPQCLYSFVMPWQGGPSVFASWSSRQLLQPCMRTIRTGGVCAWYWQHCEHKGDADFWLRLIWTISKAHRCLASLRSMSTCIREKRMAPHK